MWSNESRLLPIGLNANADIGFYRLKLPTPVVRGLARDRAREELLIHEGLSDEPSDAAYAIKLPY